MKNREIKISKYDKEWSQKVRARDKKCAVCGAVNNLAAHHIEGRAKKSTRLLLENGITVCPSHHVFNNDFSAHRTPKDFKNWFKEKYPERWILIQDKLKIHMSEKQAVEEFIKQNERPQSNLN